PPSFTAAWPLRRQVRLYSARVVVVSQSYLWRRAICLLLGGWLGAAVPVASAGGGSWTQSEWLTPSVTLIIASRTSDAFFRPSRASLDGSLTGTFGVCVGSGKWCQSAEDAERGRALRLLGNHRSDGGNPWSSDLNADGISEVLIANWWNDRRTTAFDGGWIYWGGGSPDRPRWDARISTTLPSVGAHGMLPADLDGDGRPEVIVSNFSSDSTRNVSSTIYWGRPGARQVTGHDVSYSPTDRTELPAPGAHGIAVADLNRDGRPEVILARANDDDTHKIDSYIYWGQAGGERGITYSPAARSGLPTRGAHGVAVADLNRDGWPELIFANKFDGDKFAIESYIYWARPGGRYGVTYSAEARTALPTLGAFGVAVADLNADGWPEVVFANWSDGKTYAVNSYVYWGRPGGRYGVSYGPIARTELPGIGAMKVSIVDLNKDGQPDIVLQNYDGGFARVFWGPLPIGGLATSFWTLPEAFGFRGLSLSDLNADGYVDLLVSQQGIDPNPAGSYWQGGVTAHIHFHRRDERAPYVVTPTFQSRAFSAASIYASFGQDRATNGDWFSQPRPVYGTAFPQFGVLESVLMHSAHDRALWKQVQTAAEIRPGTGITLFVAASDDPAALNDPAWVTVGAVGDGVRSFSLSGVQGRYARYRLILWRDETTEASPVLRRITFDYAAPPAKS
ncbi:MAG: VCBS repeat-containing protein, partial [Anaerolineae bacterium]|nr:VCBS repeat-containing protein [Anaerolineae bacterium]